MLYLEVSETGSDNEPMGFNCGASNIERAQQIADDLRVNLRGSMSTFGPERTNGGDDIVTVRCRPGTLATVTMLVEAKVAIMRARGQLS